MNEGIIKFNCRWIKDKPLPPAAIYDINYWREKLFSHGLIGAYKDGIGYGNISIRSANDSFIITGSGTGSLEKLTEKHFVTVTGYNLKKNSLTCRGPVKASSESLSHAVIYESSPGTNAVIHIHNMKMWKELFDKVPTTKKDIEYGTPDMAVEIKRLFEEGCFRSEKIMVMGGHQEGIISFGNTLKEAGEIILGKK